MKDIKGYKILIVDDEIEYQNVTSIILKDAGYITRTCSSGAEALDYISNNVIDLVITDLRMPGMSGLELIIAIRKLSIETDILVVTAFGSIESAVNAIKMGAADYFVKSDEPANLLIKIKRLAKINRLERKNSILLKNQYSHEAFLDTKNKKYRNIIEMCNKTANTGINILLLGESGVGKEVIANYIHRISDRSSEPFVPVNCQVFPEGVIESELFGHEKGAFTGALDNRIGKFEEANYGTLFLDEICDLHKSTQGKLLRSLESRKIERIGSNKVIDLDIRLISATNKNPLSEIKECRFREDLLYRINTLTLTIPPLRNRKEDLPGLIDFFLRKIERDQKKKVTKIDDSVIDYLMAYDYPGNIRELKNIIERMVALSENSHVTSKELCMPTDFNSISFSELDTDYTLRDARAIFEKEYITASFSKLNGNVTQCASELGITSRQLRNKIAQYNILK